MIQCAILMALIALKDAFREEVLITPCREHTSSHMYQLTTYNTSREAIVRQQALPRVSRSAERLVHHTHATAPRVSESTSEKCKETSST